MSDICEVLPTWDALQHPPVVNHRDPEQVSGQPAFTRVCFVDVPKTIDTLEQAFDIYASEAEHLLRYGIRVADQTRVLIPTENIVSTVLEELPALKQQQEVHGGSLLPGERFLGSVVKSMSITFDMDDDTVPDALHAYTFGAIRSPSRQYMIGDLHGFQVTRNVADCCSAESAKGILFDIDLVLKKAKIF